VYYFPTTNETVNLGSFLLNATQRHLCATLPLFACADCGLCKDLYVL